MKTTNVLVIGLLTVILCACVTNQRLSDKISYSREIYKGYDTYLRLIESSQKNNLTKTATITVKIDNNNIKQYEMMVIYTGMVEMNVVEKPIICINTVPKALCSPTTIVSKKDADGKTTIIAVISLNIYQELFILQPRYLDIKIVDNDIITFSEQQVYDINNFISSTRNRKYKK
jgi:hypothetical protein